jgi:dihydrolipoamide dehydrogenase
MSEITVDVAVIGAGTAGLSAFKEAIKVSDNVVLIDHGPLGTTCARSPYSNRRLLS